MHAQLSCIHLEGFQVAKRVREAKQWMVRSGDNSIGPVSIELIERGLEAGKIPQDAEMVLLGGDKWRNVMEIFGPEEDGDNEDPEPVRVSQVIEVTDEPSQPEQSGIVAIPTEQSAIVANTVVEQPAPVSTLPPPKAPLQRGAVMQPTVPMAQPAHVSTLPPAPMPPQQQQQIQPQPQQPMQPPMQPPMQQQQQQQQQQQIQPQQQMQMQPQMQQPPQQQQHPSSMPPAQPQPWPPQVMQSQMAFAVGTPLPVPPAMPSEPVHIPKQSLIKSLFG